MIGSGRSLAFVFGSMTGILGLLGLLLSCQKSSFHVPAGWERLHPGFTAPVHQLLRDPDNPRLIYAACGWQAVSANEYTGGVLRSADDGERWIDAHQGLPKGVDVLALVFAPYGFKGPERPLVAGTRGAGLFLSTDGAVSWHPLGQGTAVPDWRQLTVQALVELPDSHAVLAGTKGHGILLGTDGGTVWQPYNDGLRNLTIQALVADPDGGVVAAAWYGGLYHNTGSQQAWQHLTPEDEGMAVATVAVGGDGTLWAGLQNGGLLAREHGARAFLRQGHRALQDVRVLALAVYHDRISVGTDHQGVASGTFGGRFTLTHDGLEGQSITALSPHPEDPTRIIAGTLAGLHRGRPPVLWTTLAASSLTVTIVLALVGVGWWRRSDHAAAARAIRQFTALREHIKIITFIDRLGMDRPAGKRQVFLEVFARRFERLKNDPWPYLREYIWALVRLVAALDTARSERSAAARQEVAECLFNTARTIETATEAWKRDNIASRFPAHFPETAWIRLLALASRMRLLAGIVQAESFSHLAALREDLEEAERQTKRNPSTPIPQVRFVEAQRRLFDTFEQLRQTLGSEDRTLVIGQALASILQEQEQAERRYHERPTMSKLAVVYGMESLRQLLSLTIRDIRQSAELKVELCSRLLTTQRETVVVLEIRNEGQGNAHDVEAELLVDEEIFETVRSRQGLKYLLRDQSARLEFLIKPHVSDRIRLRFRVTYNDLERQGHVFEFADLAELRAPAKHTFMRLHPNPYVVGRPLGQGDIFVGRDETIERIADNLGGAHQDNVVILIGQRRMGKTSILRRLRSQLAGFYVPVLVDLQGLLAEGDAAFFRELTAVIQDELAEAGIDVAAPRGEDLRLDPGGTFRRQFLRQVKRRLGERRLLLMIDEFEVLEERIRSGELTPQILPYLRSLMQHENAVSFIFAGTHRLDELTSDYWGVLFNLAVYLDVGHFSPSQVARLLTVPAGKTFEIDPLAIDKAFQLTGGHPHFSQLLAHELVEFRNREKLVYVTVQDVNAAADEVVVKGQLHITYLWNEASNSERMLMLALQDLLDREGLASVASAHRYLKACRVEPGDLPAAARRLERQEVLTSQAGHLSFRMELLRRWLRRNHSLELFALVRSGTGSDSARNNNG